jgi:hypothetical protein
MSTVTLVLRALYFPRTLLKILRLVWPYIIVLGLFGSFVVWNGSVVLGKSSNGWITVSRLIAGFKGDKGNHVATLHLPQMLYIWAYTSFFSVGLTYPFVAQGLLSIFATIPVAAVLEPLLIFGRHRLLPRPAVLIGLGHDSDDQVQHHCTSLHPCRQQTLYLLRLPLPARIPHHQVPRHTGLHVLCMVSSASPRCARSTLRDQRR